MKLNRILLIIFIVLFLLILNEVSHGIIRQKKRHKYFKMAEKHSKELNKPLVVIGDPYYGMGSIIYNMFMKGYGCGDETVDLTGAPKCPNGIKKDILSYLSSKQSNSCVLFISCVLEYVDKNEIDEVIRQIKRVSGSLDNVFIVSVNKNTLASRFYNDKNSNSKQIVFGPPEYNDISYESL
jgi:hypothetical protein